MLEKLLSEFLFYLLEKPAKQYEFIGSQALSVPLFPEGLFLASAESPKPRLSLFYHFLLTSLPGYRFKFSWGFFGGFFFLPLNNFSIASLVKAPFSVTEEASKGIIKKKKIFFSLSGKQSKTTYCSSKLHSFVGQCIDSCYPKYFTVSQGIFSHHFAKLFSLFCF